MNTFDKTMLAIDHFMKAGNPNHGPDGRFTSGAEGKTSHLMQSQEYVGADGSTYRHEHNRTTGEHRVIGIDYEDNPDFEYYRGSSESKAHAALEEAGVKSPRSLKVEGDRHRDPIMDAAERFEDSGRKNPKQAMKQDATAYENASEGNDKAGMRKALKSMEDAMIISGKHTLATGNNIFRLHPDGGISVMSRVGNKHGYYKNPLEQHPLSKD